MLPKNFVKGFDKRRLKGSLALFFIALTVPTAVLIWQAYSQLKWEAFHQYRGMAEELTNRVDFALAAQVDTAESRSFADYAFLVVSGDPGSSFVQRSPLSELPPTQDLPGVIGYFQVGAEGEFSTPLLPQGTDDPGIFGISAEEYEERQRVARAIQSILSDNRLVRSQPPGRRSGLASMPASPAESSSQARQVAEEADGADESERRPVELSALRVSNSAGDKDAVEEPVAFYRQEVFDELKAPKKSADDEYQAGGLGGESIPGSLESKERLNTLGRVADLKLDEDLQRKSKVVEQSRAGGNFGDEQRADTPGRMKRREQIALPESEAATVTPAASAPVTNLGGIRNLRISTFESALDPFEFSLLDSGHFVLFRKVWREAERYIQGLLIDQNAFLEAAFDKRFGETGLSAMSNLIVGYQDDVIHTIRGERYATYAGNSQSLDGTLLYQRRLSAPFDSLELIYSINGLPPGPGATVLGWVTLVLAVVFLGGFYSLYRLGLSQINLARQQQDFVSAVSHELKTPLTSIRMYGEMLKEGWAEPEKQQQYYEFIHDESERLTRLISNVLQLARITRNEPRFDLETVAVGELMSQVKSKISNQVERTGFELDFRQGDKVADTWIRIDDDCFAQIIINLVDNALKFSRDAEQKRIEISSRFTSDNRVLFAVRDFGPGVPKNQMKKIFQLFYRSESELTRETVGTGIGLAIVHQLSQAMGGKVDVLNMDPGVEFRVTFPVVVPIG